jgi:UDP-N-acetylglucosamine transferase subunit ALG13
MMFLTVGTGPQGFDRLVSGVDVIAPAFEEPIVAQIGRTEYVPDNLEWFRFTSEDRIHELYRTATAVVSHAGAGTILTAFSYEKPVVVVPRRVEYGEHNDDHQLELANALEERPDVFVVTDTDSLRPAIERARSRPGGSAGGEESLVRFLRRYLGDLEP